MAMPGRIAQFTRNMDSKDNLLNMKIDIDFKQPFYVSANYDDFHEFYKKMMAALNEQVVIKKK